MREREVVAVGGRRSERHYIYYWGKLIEEFSALMVPRQCPVALLAKVDGREGRVFGSAESKAAGSGLFCDYTSEERS
jgi:hypothetical protein